MTTKVRYQLVGRRGRPANPNGWIERLFTVWPSHDLELCARLVVASYVHMDGVWTRPVVCIFHTPNGFEFDAMDTQHFMVECPMEGPWYGK